MKISSLKNTITSGGNTYPLFICFISAKDVLKISAVPNFAEKDTHESIAKNLIKSPVLKWQRPLIDDKRINITNIFNDTGEFMPNPVLLSQNPYSVDTAITIKPKVIGGQTSDMWELDIEENEDSLWIIDGQHRVNGLGHEDCKQRENKLPVVLLLNDNKNYTPAIFAKIFAQVTTTATALGDLHKEWIEYAFKLGNRYKSKKAWTNSMNTVIRLCSDQDFKDGKKTVTNIFHNEISFNDKTIADTKRLNCIVFTELIHDYYYNETPASYHLTPLQLSEQISKAYTQLELTIPNPDDSVFYSKSPHQKHIIMTKSVIRGFLSYLLHHVDPKVKLPLMSDWKKVFKKLNFHKTDFDWSTYTETGTGWMKKSEDLATLALVNAFYEQKIPDLCADLTECIVHGNNSFMTLNCSKGSKDFDTKIHSRVHVINKPGGVSRIKISDKSLNCRHLQIVDKSTTHNVPEIFRIDFTKSPEKLGVQVPFSRKPTVSRPHVYRTGNKFTLEIKRTKYGGATDLYEIKFSI